jgi:hypothetical protein
MLKPLKSAAFVSKAREVIELNALRADFKNLQHNKGLHRKNIAIQAYGV